MRLIFRYDDYSAAAQFPYEVDEALFNLFLALHVPLLVAVTPRMTAAMRDPFNQQFFAIEEDARRVELLSRGLQQGWQLALHGYTHQSTPALSGSEFKGEPKAVQEEKIIAGLHLLRQCFPSTPITVFVPPWNSYDAETVTCLIEQGFTALCAGDAEVPRRVGSLTIIPSLMSPRDLADYLEHFSLPVLLDEVGEGCLVVTMHQYEFRQLGRNDYVGLEQLALMLRQLEAAGAVMSTIDLTMPPHAYKLKNQARLQAKLHLLQQVRQQRARSWWRLANLAARPLSVEGGLAVKTAVAYACWYVDRANRQLRAWLRPLKKWALPAKRQQQEVAK